MISLFPNSDQDGGLSNPSSLINIEVKWAEFKTDFMNPPSTSSSPHGLKAIGAVYLKAASIIAMTAISSSLF